jgi:hypothetical protein
LERAISFGGTHGGFSTIFASIGTVFAVQQNKGAFRYTLEKFEDVLSINGRENALRVTRPVNILCRNVLAKI